MLVYKNNIIKLRTLVVSCLGAHGHRWAYRLSLSFSYPFGRRFWFMRRRLFWVPHSVDFWSPWKIVTLSSASVYVIASVRFGVAALRCFLRMWGHVNDCKISCIFSREHRRRDWFWRRHGLLGVFARTLKAPINSVMSVCRSAYRQVSTRSPLAGFSWNLLLLKSVKKILIIL
jgi:hypothetical protein